MVDGEPAEAEKAGPLQGEGTFNDLDLTESNNSLTGLNNKLTGEVNVLTGQVNELTGEVNRLTGQVNSLTGDLGEMVAHTGRAIEERERLLFERTAEVNMLTGLNNELTGCVNELTGQVNALTGQVNGLTGQVNELTGRINGLMGELAEAVARSDRLMQERERLLQARTEFDKVLLDGPRPEDVKSSPARGNLPETDANLFMIVSNNRSGSTWLQGLLSRLPDVSTDLEFKWDINYSPLPVHHVLREQSPMISDVLTSIRGDRSVVGSKFVFDPTPLSGRQTREIFRKFDEGIRVVHLVRDYRDVFLSRRRGVFHRVLEHRVGSFGKRLRSELTKGIPATVVAGASYIEVDAVCEELTVYLLNDLRTHTATSSFQKMQVDYRSVEIQLGEIANFIGSKAEQQVVAAALNESPLQKLPAVPPEQLVANMDELEPIFRHFEALRRQLLRIDPTP